MTVMKTLVALVAIVVLSACATTREGGPPSEPAALDSVLAAWGPAWSSSDAGKLVPLYTEDVYFEDVPLGAVVKNRAVFGGRPRRRLVLEPGGRWLFALSFVNQALFAQCSDRNPPHRRSDSSAACHIFGVPRRQDQPGV